MDQTKLEQYAEIQALVQKEARDIAEQVYKERGAQFAVPTVPFHIHNGVDTPTISQDNVILTEKLQSLLVSVATETYIIKNIFNVSRISFHAFAANNAGGGGATQRASINGEVIFGKCFDFTGSGSSIVVTTVPPGDPFKQVCNFIYIKETIANSVSGGAISVSGTVATTVTLPNPLVAGALIPDGTGSVVLGHCNSVLSLSTSQAPITVTGSLTNKVGIAPYLAYSVDGTGAEIVRLNLDSYTNNSLTFTCTLAPTWQLQGIIIIE